jgi:predicted permease
MLVSFHGIMEVLVLGIFGYLVIGGIKGNIHYLDFLTKLIIRFTLPALVFSNLCTRFNPSEIDYWWAFPLLAVVSNIAGAILGMAYAKADRKVRFQGEFTALVAFQNAIFLPIAMAPVLFQSDRLSLFMTLIFLYNFLSVPTFFTLAVWLVNGHMSFVDRLKETINPPNIATACGLVFAFMGWGGSVPEWVLRPMETFGSLTAPLSTLLVGGIIVTNLPKAKPSDWSEPIKASILKCVVTPIIGAAVVLLFHPPEWIALFIIMQSVMPSALLIALVAPQEEQRQRIIAGGILISSLASIVTVPLFMGIFGALYR